MDKKKVILPLRSKYHKKGKLTAFNACHIVGVYKNATNANRCTLLMFNGKEYEILQPVYSVIRYVLKYGNSKER